MSDETNNNDNQESATPARDYEGELRAREKQFRDIQSNNEKLQKQLDDFKAAQAKRDGNLQEQLELASKQLEAEREKSAAAAKQLEETRRQARYTSITSAIMGQVASKDHRDAVKLALDGIRAGGAYDEDTADDKIVADVVKKLKKALPAAFEEGGGSRGHQMQGFVPDNGGRRSLSLDEQRQGLTDSMRSKIPGFEKIF